MPFLRTRDYPVYIQTLQLNQITQSNLGTRISAEEDAIEEISEYIRARYDVIKAFADTFTFDITGTYQGNALVELKAAAWAIQPYVAGNQVLFTDNKVYLCLSNTAAEWVAGAYTVGEIVQFTDGKYYICILNTVGNAPPSNVTYWAVTTNQAPGNATFWMQLGWYEQLFYLQYPYPIFDLNGNYKIGDRVFWNGKIYPAIINSFPTGNTGRIQYDYSSDIPAPNYFPDDTNNGATQWGVGVPYGITGVYIGQTGTAWSDITIYAKGDLSTDTNGVLWQSLKNGNLNNIPGSDIINWQSITWVEGDNRNRGLVNNTIHLTLFNLHSNISPQNIPILREKNHIRAIEWCEKIKMGQLDVDLFTMPKLQPAAGGRILIDSRPKNNNNW